jgi:transcriptional regulator with GAF, ATPase, and Fis domain
MSPKLIAITGSPRGTTFTLAEDESSIGRDASSLICLNDISVSRRHCLIRRNTALPPNNHRAETAPSEVSVQAESEESGLVQYQIVDLESHNGTFVNEIPIREHSLSHGDQITVGKVVLLFLLHEEDTTGTVVDEPDECNLITRSTIRLRAEDVVYLSPEKMLAELPANERVVHDLNALLKISTTINSLRDLKSLQTQLFKLILEVIPAERAAILLMDESREQVDGVCGWSRARGSLDSLPISQTILNEVLREGVGLLSNDLLESEAFSEKPSLADSQVCAVLCVRLSFLGRTLGVIYLDTSNSLVRFDEGHLQLLTAIASTAAAHLANARRVQSLEEENQRLQQETSVRHQMIGESPQMRAVYQLIGKVAVADSTVLIRGESGTGKELAARAIHDNSPRVHKPFVAINGASLAEPLLESELFGHEKGAFTGAIAQKRGKLEVADGGMLFLDEVGELTPAIQAKLLRVLQNKEFERVGGNKTIKVDVRILAATNKDLEEAVDKGEFRRDLYYRLNVVSIVLPSLKERREDIQLLASHFLAIYSKKCGRKLTGISRATRELLQNHDWPGNVRELENVIERALVLGSTETIVPEDLPETMLERRDSAPGGYHEELKKAKQTIVRKALESAGGNYTQAAKSLGLHPTNLHRLIRNLDLRIPARK